MSKFTVYLLAPIKLTMLVCVSILCVFSLVYLLIYLPYVLVGIPLGIAMYISSDEFKLNDLVDVLFSSKGHRRDHMDVISYHAAIRSWVMGCIGFDDWEDMPLRIKRIFVLPVESWSGSDSSGPLLEGRMPNHRERALIQLSSILAFQGIALRSKVQSAYFFWQCTSLIAIVLGMITTILVSVSSTEFGRGDGRNQRLIRLLAIIFPALGTAVAAIIAFYSPQAEWSQASRTLASVNQLHGQVALGVWKLKCPTADDEDAKLFTTTIEDWSKRFHDIQAISSIASEPSGAGKESSPRGGKTESGNTGQGLGQGPKPPQ
jgi:hypothetical protein